KQAEPRSIRDADRAAQLADTASDRATQGYALATAARARIKAAIMPGNAERAGAYQLRAIDQLRQAVEVAPQHPLVWSWHEMLVVGLKVYIGDPQTDAKLKSSLRAEALKHVDEALRMAPPRERSRIGDLKRELEARS